MLYTFSGRILFLIGLLLIGWLQYKLWTGEGGKQDHQRLQERVADQQLLNEQLAERNRILAAEVNDLKQGSEAIEEHARLDLGLVKSGELFIQLPPLEGGAPVKSPATGVETNEASSVKHASS